MTDELDMPCMPEDRAKVRKAAMKRQVSLWAQASNLESIASYWRDRPDRGWERNICLKAAAELRQLAGGAIE